MDEIKNTINKLITSEDIKEKDKNIPIPQPGEGLLQSIEREIRILELTNEDLQHIHKVLKETI